MRFDIFFSICQTPVDGHTPTEAEMYRNFFQQVEAADAQGYGTAWVAESHLSIEVQKRNANPVVPHFPGEIGLNADIFQLANHVFNRTKQIHVGSAVMNLLVNGGLLTPVTGADDACNPVEVTRDSLEWAGDDGVARHVQNRVLGQSEQAISVRLKRVA